MNLTEVYNDIYEKDPQYNYESPMKNCLVDIYAGVDNTAKILDAGCGEGMHLKRLLGYGLNIFGIELSEVCCKKYLQNVPHKNASILDFGKDNEETFDRMICMDVLEHLPLEELDKNLKTLRKLSNSVFFGIANHSDVILGHELHLIQENADWWEKKLVEYYPATEKIFETPGGDFFIFECGFSGMKAKYEKLLPLIQLMANLLFVDQINAKLSKEKIFLEEQASKQNEAFLLAEKQYVDLTEKWTGATRLLAEKETAEQALRETVCELEQKIAQMTAAKVQTENRLSDVEKQLECVTEELEKSQILYRESVSVFQVLNGKHSALLNSKAVRLSNRIKKLFKRPVAE